MSSADAGDATAAAGGHFGAVSSEPQRVTANEIDGVDLQNLEPTEQEIVGAEEFVIYGKANIEQWNRPGPGEDNLYIEMDALEGNIDQLLALENISIGHNDVRIGEPLEAHTLDEPSTVHIDSDETLSFEAGDELRTEVIREGEPLPGDNGTADEDALWLAANLFGQDDPRGSRFSQKARLGAYYGELDGFSVTVDKKDMTLAEEGTIVHDVDFLAVTVGDDEMIKNPGSSFGVAEFQALFGSAPPADDPGATPSGAQVLGTETGEEAARTTTLSEQLMSGILQRVLGSSRDALASQAIRHAYDEGTDLETAVQQTAGDENHDAVMQAVTELDKQLSEQAETLVEEAEDAEEVENRAADLADELGVDKEVVMAAVEEIEEMQDPDGDGGEPDGGDDEGGGGGPPAQQQAVDEMELAERLMETLPDDANLSTEELTTALESLEYEGLVAPDPEAIEQAFADADLDLGGGDDGLTEDHVEQLVDERVEAQMGDVQETIEEQLDNIGEDVTETLTQQLETGTTPGPTGGGTDSTDFESQIDDMAEDLGIDMEADQ